MPRESLKDRVGLISKPEGHSSDQPEADVSTMDPHLFTVLLKYEVGNLHSGL